ncbi:MAG: hypothetical protein LBE23_05840 [Vagococcus sp.]|nr:hypothetical protein [Vagococcus sp.]
MPQKIRAKVPTGDKECGNCHKTKSLVNFYQITNKQASSDGKFSNVCKTCIKKDSLNSDGSLNVEGFKRMLQLMDRAYATTVLDSAINETKEAIENGKGRKDLIGNYIKNLNLSQYSQISFLQSIQMQDGGMFANTITSTSAKSTKNNKDDDVYISQVDDFEVTPEMVDKFGEGYTKKMYRLMDKKYKKLEKNYNMKTAMHEEALATYVSRKVREEIATAEGNVVDADKWSKAAAQAAIDGKLTPKQLSETDLQGGLANFSDIFRAVEEAKDRIKIFPEFKYRPIDAADFIIWDYVNYERNLNNLPEVSYEEIYKFYDAKKKEYVDQYGDPYGIFKDDPSEINRDSIEKFITVPIEFRDGDSDG